MPAHKLGNGTALLSCSPVLGEMQLSVLVAHSQRDTQCHSVPPAHPSPWPCMHSSYSHTGVQKHGYYSPKEATEEGHIDERGKEAEVQEGSGVHTAVVGADQHG